MVEHGLRILVVDDDEGIRELFASWLEGDHSVTTAPDGREGLDALDESVDLLFLDRDMPGPSGIDVARRVAAAPQDPHVVVVSSMAVDFDVAAVPIDGYLRKPVTEADVRAETDRYRSQQAVRTALDEYFRLTSELAGLEAHGTADELAECDEYDRLRARAAEKRADVDEALAAEDDWVNAFESCTDGAAGRLGDQRA